MARSLNRSRLSLETALFSHESVPMCDDSCNEPATQRSNAINSRKHKTDLWSLTLVGAHPQSASSVQAKKQRMRKLLA